MWRLHTGARVWFIGDLHFVCNDVTTFPSHSARKFRGRCTGAKWHASPLSRRWSMIKNTARRKIAISIFHDWRYERKLLACAINFVIMARYSKFQWMHPVRPRNVGVYAAGRLRGAKLHRSILINSHCISALAKCHRQDRLSCVATREIAAAHFFRLRSRDVDKDKAFPVSETVGAHG